MIRVLHIVPSYMPAVYYGGVPVSVEKLARELVRAGAEVTVFTTLANGATELNIPAGAPQSLNRATVYYFNRWTGDHSHFSPGLLRAVWRHAHTFDIVLVHSWWNLVALGAVLLCRFRRRRVVLFPHGMLSPYSLKNRLRIFFQKTLGAWLLKDIPVFATSEQEAGEIRALHPRNTCYVLPNIIHLPAWTPRLQREPGALVRLLFLSRIDPKKGLELLFEALIEIPAPWRLGIAGDGNAEYVAQLREQAENLGIADQIDWHGWLDGPNKWNLIETSDLLVLPSRNENFALVVLEALALGTPVLISDQVGLSDYVEKNAFGWVVPLNTAALRQALQSAILQTAERARIKKQAPEQVRRDFDPAKLAKQYLEQLVCLK